MATTGDDAMPEPTPASATALQTVFRRGLREGDVIDAYRIERVVHASAQAVVYAATDPVLGTAVAIKEYMPVRLARRDDSGSVVAVDPIGFDSGLQAFIVAARMLARCDQASLMRVLRVSQANGTAYQVMPWVEGTPLRDLRLAMSDPPDEPALRALLDGLMDAVAAVHASGAVHGGIDPAQILLQPDDKPLLLGPGGEARDFDRRDAPGPAVDIDALAAVARFCITGLPPRRGAELAPLASVIADAFEGRPAVHYSPALLAAIDQALSPALASRPQSVADFRAALSAAEPAPAPEPEPEDSPVVAAERLRVRQFVDSIDFGDDTVPRLSGPPPVRPPPPAAAAAAGLSSPRVLPVRAVAMAAAAVLAVVVTWALVRSPTPKDRPASVALAPPGPNASTTPLAPAASVPLATTSGAASATETATAASAATAATAATPPVAAAVSPAAPAASVLSMATPTPAPTASPRARKAAAPIAKNRPTPPTRTATATPRLACGARTEFSLYRCMQTQCAKARYSAHAQCLRLRKTGRVD